MFVCPECGASGADDARCGGCGAEWPARSAPEPTPQATLPSGSSQAARSVEEVARTLGVRPLDRSSGTFVEVTQPPARPIAVEIVPSEKPRRRTWLLFLLFLAVVLYFIDQRQERRTQRSARAVAAAQEAEPPVDEAYLNLALDSMLTGARALLRVADEPDAVGDHVERMRAQATDLRARLERTRLETSTRDAYLEGLDVFDAFLLEIPAFIEQTEDPELAAEDTTTLDLEVVEAAFARAQRR